MFKGSTLSASLGQHYKAPAGSLAGMTNKRENDMFTLFFIVLWIVLFFAIGEALVAIYKEPFVKKSLVYASLVTAFVWLAVYNFG
jgi:hypothetical protein